MQSQSSFKKSFALHMLLAIIAGLIIGLLFPNGKLSLFIDIAKMAIHWVKIIAGPYLFIAVFLALLKIHTEASVGIKLVAIAIFNTAMAIAIGISVILVTTSITTFNLQAPANAEVSNATPQLNLSSWLKTFSPNSLFEPLIKNEILLIALLALLLGIATRKALSQEVDALDKVESFFLQLRKVLETLLLWVLKIMPIAVFFIIAGSVSQYGLMVFTDLFKFAIAITLALTLQCILVYGSWVIGVAKIPLSRLWQEVRTPLFYAIGENSSLATLPLTLKALKNLKVSDRAASLGAGVATNLNNDGIVLYEASAVFFVAAISNIDWSIFEMILAALACIVAAMGITGVPEAGFISLTVVMGALGLPLETLPLLLSVDWILGRFRSGVNVLSDMTLAITLDHFAPLKNKKE